MSEAKDRATGGVAEPGREPRSGGEAVLPGDLEAGRLLLHYRIVEKVGEGGMGQVYVAEDLKLGRRVALKLLPPEMADDPERLERFRREARIVASLNHPNIVTLYAVEESEGIHFLTMELVEGETLKARIPPRGMPVGELLDLALPVADALAAAHERGVTHRDLKPDNLMVDRSGRVKILDFGLAKVAAGSAPTDSISESLTEAGRLLGTMPYMSPEQLMGQPADARSDIFSLGVLLHEMATGERPFQGPAAGLISSILRDTPSSIDQLRDGLPQQLGRVVRRCLEKDPEERTQSALEVRDELRRLQRQLAVSEVRTASADAGDGARVASAAATGVARRRRAARAGVLVLALALAAAAVAVLLALWGWPALRRPDAGRETPGSPGASRRTSLAVLYFQNLTGDRELDWLRTGITDLLVTDLSQCPEIEVLSARRLHQLLADLDALDRPTLPRELIRRLAEDADLEVVVQGSFARVGERLRMTFTLERAASGEVLRAELLKGRGEDSLFDLIDELSAAVRNHFSIARPPESPATLEAATTSSLQAWRNYSESLVLEQQFKRSEAIALLEKAVEIDPGFALARANLGRLYANLGRTAEAREHMRRAVELVDRLPLDERYRVEAIYYGGRWSTYGRAIEVYREGLARYPERQAWRNNLARRYAFLERYEEALVEFERLIDEGTAFAGTYSDAADVYAALGRQETGYRVLSEFAGGSAGNWFLDYALGVYLAGWGRLEEASASFDRAAELRPGERAIHQGRWQLAILLRDWRGAELEAAASAALPDSLGRWQGGVSLARTALFRGRSAEASKRLQEAVAAYGEPGAFTALGRCLRAELLLSSGEPEAARLEAERAQEEGRDDWPELKALFLAALAEQELGRERRADAIVDTLRRRWEAHPNAVEERQLHHLRGRLALARGDGEAAVEALRQAAALLPARGVKLHRLVDPDHLPVWTALGEAELAVGRLQEARGWFERAAESGFEHLTQPVPYVRSFYFLGRIDRQLGDLDASRRSFERFLDFWRGGDLDPERLEEALAAVD